MKKRKMVLCVALIFLLAFANLAIAQENEGAINRLDFTKKVLEILNIEPVTEVKSHFRDIAKGSDAKYIEAAYQNKIISGYQNHFYPQNSITKEEAVTILVKALGEKNFKTTDTVIAFQDRDSISDWAKPYIAYALEKDIISVDADVFGPNKKMTKAEAEEILKNAKNIFTKDGLTAYKMLQKADQNLNEFDSYKFKGKLKMNAKVSDGEEQPLYIEMDQYGAFQKPEKIYIKSAGTVSAEGIEEPEEQTQESEVFMEDGIMYIRTGDGDKWLKIDTNPFMLEVEKLIGKQSKTQGLLSQEQVELFGIYATYGSDEKIEGKEYYVLNIDLDYDTFKEIYKELLDKMGPYFENIIQTNAEKVGIPLDMQEIKQAIDNMIKNIDLDAKYKYYIDKQTKQYQKLETDQNVKMDIDGTTIQTNMQGEYTYYDFGEEIDFPDIAPQDIQDMPEIFEDIAIE